MCRIKWENKDSDPVTASTLVHMLLGWILCSFSLCGLSLIAGLKLFFPTDHCPTQVLSQIGAGQQEQSKDSTDLRPKMTMVSRPLDNVPFVQVSCTDFSVKTRLSLRKTGGGLWVLAEIFGRAWGDG